MNSLSAILNRAPPYRKLLLCSTSQKAVKNTILIWQVKAHTATCRVSPIGQEGSRWTAIGANLASTCPKFRKTWAIKNIFIDVQDSTFIMVGLKDFHVHQWANVAQMTVYIKLLPLDIECRSKSAIANWSV
jgi:hypothetical protein